MGRAPRTGGGLRRLTQRDGVPRRGDIVLVRSRRHEPYQAVARPALVVQGDAIDADA